MYQIGDRVRCLVDKPENNGHIVCGSTGTVFYEKTLNSSFDSQPHEYRMETDEFPTAEKLHDLIFQAIEIEGMESDFLLETLVEENNEYYSSDECVVTPEIVRTSEPSKFIMWGNRLPHIFTVDKQRSKLVFNATVV